MGKCEQCIYYPKCDEYPFDESGCKDFKDRSRFVELPCKVGDTVYQTDGVRLYESTIGEVTFTTRHILCVTESVAFDERAIGKSVFLTPEEAEAALAKMDK